MPVSDDDAKVIPLRKRPSRACAQPQVRRRATGSARTASTTNIAAATREVDRQHRTASAKASAADSGTHVAGKIAEVAAFLRRRITGDYEVDEFGFDPHFNDAVALPLLRLLSHSWFRVEVSGVENLPTSGPGLVVANHAGVLPLDALMIAVAVRDHHPTHRNLRLLAADLVFDLPVIGSAARKAGHTMACAADAQQLLGAGELAAVFPEGYKGLGKPFKDRYKLQRFGRGGFVSAALRVQAPIIPCSIVGSEEIYPMIADLKLLARLLGLPYFPVTPLFPLAGVAGLIPLPSKWHIAFGEPIQTTDFQSSAADDPMVTFELTDQVRETIQQTLYWLLAKRRNPFFD